MNKIIERLHKQDLVWQGSAKVPTQQVSSTGFDELNQQLGGGFPKGIIEVQSISGIGELRLLLPAIRQSVSEQRLAVFIDPYAKVCAQALATQGFELDKIVIISPDKFKDCLWAAEQCLSSGACHSVVMWAESPLEVHHIKRLKMASEVGNCQQFILRANKRESLTLPVDLSISLTPHIQGLSAQINKRKRGWPSNTFTINMAELWPSLTLSSGSENVVNFPAQRVG